MKGAKEEERHLPRSPVPTLPQLILQKAQWSGCLSYDTGSSKEAGNLWKLKPIISPFGSLPAPHHHHHHHAFFHLCENLGIGLAPRQSSFDFHAILFAARKADSKIILPDESSSRGPVPSCDAFHTPLECGFREATIQVSIQPSRGLQSTLETLKERCRATYN